MGQVFMGAIILLAGVLVGYGFGINANRKNDDDDN